MTFQYMEAREKSALVLPFSETDEFQPGMFRIHFGDGTASAAPTLQEKKSLTQGLSRRGSLTLKKGAQNVVLAIGKQRF